MSWRDLIAIATLGGLILPACDGQIGSVDSRGEGPTTPDVVPGARGGSDKSLLGVTAMVRLTSSSYLNMLRDLFGPQYAVGVTTDVDFVSSGYSSIGARTVSVSRESVGLYEQTAVATSTRAVADTTWRARWTSCTPSGPHDTVCAVSLIGEMGRRFFRRPLSAEESKRYADVASGASAAFDDFWLGIGYAVTGMMLSPHFTHLIEVGAAAPDGNVDYTDLEMASRLSFVLWDTTPDEPLLQAAERGRLRTTDGLANEVDRMLSDPRLADGARAFAIDAFQLGKFDATVSKDPSRFSDDSAALRASMRESLLRMVADVLVSQGSQVSKLLEANVAFVDANLAPFYGVTAPAISFERIALPSSGLRVGLLTEPALLTMLAGQQLTSPTKRGRFIRERLLCGKIPDPPPNVDMSVPVSELGNTRREQETSHMTNPACKTCHAGMDPIGFGLENFDALGHTQMTDNGHLVDASGTLDGTDFSDARGLARAVRIDADAEGCTVKNIFRHVTGRMEEEGEQAVNAAAAGQTPSGGTLPGMFQKLVQSDAFRRARPAP